LQDIKDIRNLSIGFSEILKKKREREGGKEKERDKTKYFCKTISTS